MNLDLYNDVINNNELCLTNLLHLCVNKKINITTQGMSIVSGTLIDYSNYFLKLSNNDKYIYVIRNMIVAIEIEDDIMGY